MTKVTDVSMDIYKRFKKKAKRSVDAFRIKTNYIKYNWLLRSKMPSHLYFSIEINQGVGFTDQMIRFGRLYKLGKYLKLNYHFSPMQPKAILLETKSNEEYNFSKSGSKSYPGIFDFLGFNWHLNSNDSKAREQNLKRIEFTFDATTFLKYNLAKPSDLYKHLQKLILKSSDSGRIPILVNFKISKLFNQFRWLNKLPESLIDYDLAEIYYKFREQNPWRNIFEANKTKVLLHIRQGDTAALKMPWGSYIQIWGRGNDPFKERKSYSDINDHRLITVSEFHKFYTELKNELNNLELSTQVHSDGFARAFLSLDKNLQKMNFNDKQLESLNNCRSDYNEEVFKIFKTKSAESKLFIGEDIEMLFDLVHAFYSCDILIVGNQQRMLPKLYSFSFKEGNGPLIITLYKSKPPQYKFLGNPHLLKNNLSVNLDDYQISLVAKSVISFLAKRYKAEAKILN